MVNSIVEAANARQSCRGFLKEKIAPDIIRRWFSNAQQAPSWCNIQPWNVVVLSDPKTTELSKRIVAAAQKGQANPDIPFPGPYPEPYLSRRRACGKELYQKMGIAKGDKEGQQKAWLRNYQLFDAPHVAIVSRDKSLGEYATLDVGVWLGYLLLIAESMGISTIPMASLAEFPDTIRDFLNIDQSQILLLGLAFGKIDNTILANAAQTNRQPIDENIRMDWL